MPFRQAHHVTGQIVKLAENKGLELHELTLEEMQSVERNISSKIFEVLTVENSVNSRVSFGGTSSVAVREQIQKAKEFLKG